MRRAHGCVCASVWDRKPKEARGSERGLEDMLYALWTHQLLPSIDACPYGRCGCCNEVCRS